MNEEAGVKNLGGEFIKKGFPEIGKSLIRLAGKVVKSHPIGGVLDEIGVLESVGKALGVDPKIETLEKVVAEMDEAKLKSLGELKRIEADITIASIELDKAEVLEITKRAEIDSKSDSWFTRHIRPMALVFLTVSYIIYIFSASFFLDPESLELAQPLAANISLLMGGVYSFYFGGRSWEKVSKTKDS